MSFFTVLLQTGDLTGADNQQAAEGVTELTREIPVWDLVMQGGWTMIPLGILSIMTIYIFVERFLMIQKALKDERNFMVKVKEYLVEGKIDAARALCSQTNNPAARMVEKGISRIGKPMKDIVSSIENVGKLEIYQLEKRMGFLATVAGAAPMIGFLGTTLGMIKTFHALKFEKTIELANISGGIMEAMVTTVAGLIIGIIAFMAYNFMVSKVDKVIHHMEGASIEFLDLLNEPGK
ncbi:MAG: MotA/TolQ/ExbB proton channel family protein [Crocinitomicaceae bacterium]|jgi:biopolymer transport protein ExbB|nr:MotA/TolQ/ExbB proton channel family protein [Crocinitomicaceae bacterium]MBK9593696.1 MotA/TolQ/ExbB proton channel family protein [Crocinitomicaceae bacterium]